MTPLWLAHSSSFLLFFKTAICLKLHSVPSPRLSSLITPRILRHPTLLRLVTRPATAMDAQWTEKSLRGALWGIFVGDAVAMPVHW